MQNPPVTRLWRSELAAALWLAPAFAFAFSLQYLVQPFVWRNWPLDELLVGWWLVFRDRLIIAALIAIVLALSLQIRSRRLWQRAALSAVAIVLGAASGEFIVRWLADGVEGLESVTMPALRWSAVALAISAVYYLWRASVDSREALRRDALQRLDIEHQRTSTRLTALRRQIEPHFLFNTLATVRRLHHTEPAAGARMLASFIDYLRRVTPLMDRSEVPLGEEIDLIQAYLDVIAMRMAGRLRVVVDVPEHLRHASVPPFALATLVENAVKHGLSPAPAGGEIAITASESGGRLTLCVTDTGVGLKLDANGGTGIGLRNVRQRLVTLYGELGALRIEAVQPSGVCATIHLPLRIETAR